MSSIYDITVQKMDGTTISLSAYKGKVLLIVNTATECGFTPQYGNLQDLYEKYHHQGLEILDFPCDQFGHQAPGSNEEIATFCTGRFGVTFPQFSKIEVNGQNQSPLFAYLKQKQGFKGFDVKTDAGKFMHKMFSEIDANYAKSDDIKWNFTKFLVNQKGEVIARFEPTEEMDDVESKVAEILSV